MDTPLPLASLFYQSATTHPARVALVTEDSQFSYGDLLSLVESLREAIAPQSAERIGILAYRSPVAFAAVQAALAEARSYVPMNPHFPAGRNAYIARKAELSTLVVGEECAEALQALLGELSAPLTLVIQGACPRILEIASKSEFVTVVSAPAPTKAPPKPLAGIPRDGSAYVLFTSGSTGEPKGVRVRQDNVQSYVRSFLSLYPISGDDRVSQTFDLTFDLSVHDQFVTWAAGATLVVYPDKALRSPIPWTRSQGVTVWFSVPSLAAFLESSRQVEINGLPDLRLSLFCGEKLTWKTSHLWRTIAPNSRQVNLYGPTEATIAITHFEIEPSLSEERCHQGGIPIGEAFPGQFCEVRDDDGNICQGIASGELWLGGDQVTPGYLGEPAKTAERFVERDGMVWYRTGDLVHRDPDGSIQYEGRLDFQVKVMGYRIELGEIEHALLKASGSAYSLADVAPIRGDMDEIYGILPGSCADKKRPIKEALEDLLPSYMVPRKIFFLADIPLNANGKMDRGAIRQRVLEGRL
ncbi:MAG: AMP-binding protein [Fibrobacteres bacterium]|nr:AMP-binding protein [Fibrobacterota bacterium]